MIKACFAIVGAVLFGLVCAVLIGAIVALPTWLLWNWLMPSIFGLPQIGIWQSLGLIILCNILFKTSVTTKKGD